MMQTLDRGGAENSYSSDKLSFFMLVRDLSRKLLPAHTVNPTTNEIVCLCEGERA
jgi:hypothetical protein